MTDATSLVQIPASIAKAIFAIMQTVDAVKKNQKNLHGGYFFASTDDIYAAVARKMGEVGLDILSLEDEIEVVTSVKADGKDSRWLRVTYRFILFTETDSWTHLKLRRTVMTPVAGPQSFQGAQSFADKSFIRHLFKIPTGDVDLDALPDDFEFASVFTKAPPPPPPSPSAEQQEPAEQSEQLEETFDFLRDGGPQEMPA